MKKYFISCIMPGVKQLGAMQFECEEDEVEEKSKELCSERVEFKVYVVPEFDEEIPINEFVSAEKLKELGY